MELIISLTGVLAFWLIMNCMIKTPKKKRAYRVPGA